MESVLVEAKLIQVSPELSRVSAAAMRSCYSSWPAHVLFLDHESFPESEVERMLKKAVELGHLDVLEHGFATWLVKGRVEYISEALVEHRFLNVSKISERRWLVTTTVRSLLEYRRRGYRMPLMDALAESLPRLAPWFWEKKELRPIKQKPKEGYPEGPEVWLLSYTDFDGLAAKVGLEQDGLALHGGFTFSVSGVSRAFTHQLVRHRFAAYSQQSQRHVRVARGTAWYGVPPWLPQDVEGDYHGFMTHVASFYSELIEKGARKEDARFVLPNAALTHITMTANAWEYARMFSLRVDPAAQWEIRDVTWAMLALSMLVAPSLFRRLDEPVWNIEDVRRKLKLVKDVVEEKRRHFNSLGPGEKIEIPIPKDVQEHEVRAYAIKY